MQPSVLPRPIKIYGFIGFPRLSLGAHIAQKHDVDPADLKGESIWAKDDGKFDDWAK